MGKKKTMKEQLCVVLSWNMKINRLIERINFFQDKEQLYDFT